MQRVNASINVNVFLDGMKEDLKAMELDWPAIKRVLFVLGSVIGCLYCFAVF